MSESQVYHVTFQLPRMKPRMQVVKKTAKWTPMSKLEEAGRRFAEEINESRRQHVQGSEDFPTVEFVGIAANRQGLKSTGMLATFFDHDTLGLTADPDSKFEYAGKTFFARLFRIDFSQHVVVVAIADQGSFPRSFVLEDPERENKSYLFDLTESDWDTMTSGGFIKLELK